MLLNLKGPKGVPNVAVVRIVICFVARGLLWGSMLIADGTQRHASKVKTEACSARVRAVLAPRRRKKD